MKKAKSAADVHTVKRMCELIGTILAEHPGCTEYALETIVAYHPTESSISYSIDPEGERVGVWLQGPQFSPSLDQLMKDITKDILDALQEADLPDHLKEIFSGNHTKH